MKTYINPYEAKNRGMFIPFLYKILLVARIEQISFKVGVEGGGESPWDELRDLLGYKVL